MADIATKSDPAKTELWVHIISAISVLLTAYVGNNPYVAVGVLVLTAVVYGVFHTNIIADCPGIKTKGFWAAIAVIGATIAGTLTDVGIPGLPPAVQRYASIAVTVLAALGYNAVRWKAKVSSTAAKQQAD